MNSLRAIIVSQFAKPRGVLGRLAGFVMSVRSSNRERSRRTLELLDIHPDDRVLEIGFGPGLAIERAATLAHRGVVEGIDHSKLMARRAARRNAAAIARGQVRLRVADAQLWPSFEAPFDRVFAVNVFMFWKDPVAVLRDALGAMKPAGTIALTFQPRKRGATLADARAGGERISDCLTRAGFENVRVEVIPMKPVDAVCVLATSPIRDQFSVTGTP